MSPSSSITITVLISIILATSAFLAVAISQSTFPIKVTEEQAINILKGSEKTDPRILYGTTINNTSPESAELEYLSLNWSNYLNTLETNPYPHSRIYVSATPVGEIRPYWFINYETYTGTGRYIIDAQTGELMLSLERVGGEITGPDYLLSTQPDVMLWPIPLSIFPNYFTDHALESKMGGFTSVVLKINAEYGYNASFPVSMKVIGVSEGFKVEQNVTSGVLKTDGSVSFLLRVFTPDSALIPGPPPQMESQVPRIDVEIDFMGVTVSESIFIVPINN